MSVADEIKVHQDWTKDGYQFKKVEEPFNLTTNEILDRCGVKRMLDDGNSPPGPDWKWDLYQRCWVHKDEN